MEEDEQQRQHDERIMRRAAELGHEPGRVARALDHPPAEAVEYQHVTEVKHRSRFFGAAVTRRFARRSRD